MALPFYYNPVTNELESTIESLGTRFGLNEISIARNTLSPTKSYTEGGRIGFANPAGLVEGIAKVPEYIKTARKVWNTGKRIFNQLRGSDKIKLRSAINTAIKEDVGPGIDVSSVSPNTGNILYRLVTTGEKQKTSTNIAELMLERNTIVANKIKPLVDKGFISLKDFTKILTDKGIKILEPHKEISRIADTYGVEKVSSPFGVTGRNFWYKNPSPEKLESIYKLRLKPEERIPIAKQFIEEFKITSHVQLNKVMQEQGYSEFKWETLNKFFLGKDFYTRNYVR